MEQVCLSPKECTGLKWDTYRTYDKGTCDTSFNFIIGCSVMSSGAILSVWYLFRFMPRGKIFCFFRMIGEKVKILKSKVKRPMTMTISECDNP